jgi:hypothetical protein
VLVPVMRIRIMRVAVGERIVPMPVGVARPRSNWISMCMPVMFVVHVLVLMLQEFVGVRVHMPLGEVQPHAPAHKHGGQCQLRCQWIAEQSDRQQRTRERRGREIGACASGAEIARSATTNKTRLMP